MKGSEVSEFKRVTEVSLPFDMRNDDPKKNYGLGGLRVWFILIGPRGAVQFQCGFPIYLPHVERTLVPTWTHTRRDEISGWDVGYHAKEPQFEGQSQMDCKHVEGGKCYYDGSSMRAQEWADEIFTIRGERPEKEIWTRLENEYRERFGNSP